MKIVKKCIIVIIIIIVGIMYSYGIWTRPIYDTKVGTGSYEDTGALNENAIYEQTFVCGDSGLCGLTIKLTKMDNQKIGSYEWVLKDNKTSKEIGKGIIDESTTKIKDFESSDAQKRGNINLEIPKQTDSKGKEYKLIIRTSGVKENECMAIYITNQGDSLSTLKIGDEITHKASVIKLEYFRFNVETFIVFLGIMCYLLGFIKFMYYLFK